MLSDSRLDPHVAVLLPSLLTYRYGRCHLGAGGRVRRGGEGEEGDPRAPRPGIIYIYIYIYSFRFAIPHQPIRGKFPV